MVFQKSEILKNAVSERWRTDICSIDHYHDNSDTNFQFMIKEFNCDVIMHSVLVMLVARQGYFIHLPYF